MFWINSVDFVEQLLLVFQYFTTADLGLGLGFDSAKSKITVISTDFIFS